MNRSIIVTFIFYLSVITLSCAQTADNDFPNVVPDTLYNNFFIRNSGWNGADGAYSLLLPDGRILWSFGDTFYGEIDPGRIRDGAKNVMVRNSFLVQAAIDSDKFESLNPGNLKETKTLIRYKDEDEQKYWYWPLDATVYNNQVQMTLMRMKQVGEGMWGFAAQAVDLAIFSLPELELTEIKYDKVKGDIALGSAICEANDGYTYLNGSTRTGLTTNLHVARAANGNLNQPWQFWNGESWQDEPSEFAIHHDVSSMFSVWQEDDRFYLFTQESNLGRKLFLFESESPLGPFSNKIMLYEVPEKDGAGDMFSYNAIVHPELSGKGELMVNYSKNPHNFWDNFNKPGSADLYRPVFIRINLKN